MSSRRLGLDLSDRTLAQGAVLAVPTVLVAVLAWTHRWMTEDGFIYLRVVRQIRAGNGPVFNAGERVEAYTGSLWVFLLALADLATPVQLEWLAVVLGLIATAAGVALATAAAQRLWAPTHGGAFFVPFGIWVFVALFPVWAYASSGLETGLAFAWLGGCAFVLATWARDGTDLRVRHMVVMGLGWLVRPELAVFTVVFLLVILGPGSSVRGRRERVRLLAAAAALPFAYQVFRMGYFGILVPNTALAKEASELRVGRGTRYLTDFTRPYWLWVPALGVLVGAAAPLVTQWWGHSRRLRVVAAFVVGGAVNAAYVVAVGGDYHHGRLLLPALFALVAPFAAVPMTRRHLAGLALVPWVVVALFVLRPEQHGSDPFANGVLAPRSFGRVTVAQSGWADPQARFDPAADPPVYHQSGIQAFPAIGADAAPELPLPYAAMWGIGASGYAIGTDAHVFDLMGLADHLAAHMESTPVTDPTQNPAPGHEKPLPAVWTAAVMTAPGSLPHAQVFPDFGNHVLEPTTGAEFHEQVAWARATLQCEPLVDLRESVRAPLTARRFLTNVLRSPSNTRLRIPVDPEEAYRELCGSGTPPEVARLREVSAARR